MTPLWVRHAAVTLLDWSAMCGRYTLTTPLEALRRLFDFPQSPNLAALYNIAPTSVVSVVRRNESARELTAMRWGLVPSWAKEISFGARTINARAETIATKSAFRAAYVARRCLVPADGFYEWRNEGGVRQPYRITLPGGGPMGFAGLWERWRPRDAGAESTGAITSFTIVTVAALGAAAEIHDRMPLVLNPDDFDLWLAEGALSASQAARVLSPRDMGFTLTRVGTRVNNVRNDDAACIEPDANAPDRPAQGALPL